MKILLALKRICFSTLMIALFILVFNACSGAKSDEGQSSNTMSITEIRKLEKILPEDLVIKEK